MKLLICDDRNIKKFRLPEFTEKFYMINFDFYFENLRFREVLTLKNIDNSWVIVSDDKLSIKSNNSIVSTISLKENIFFELKFADMPDFFKAYIVPDSIEYVNYSISNNDNISIGSDKSCNIQYDYSYNISLNIVKNGVDYWIQRVDSRSSSSYVNGYVYKIKKLNIGDVIFTNGIIIIYMKTFLMMSLFNQNINIQGLEKVPFAENGITAPITPVNDIEKNIKLYSEENLFVHKPRLKRNLSPVKVTIDPPPDKEVQQKTPAIITSGASIAMGIASCTTLISSVRTFQKGQSDFTSFVIELVGFGSMFITSLFIPMLTERWEKHLEKKKENLRQKKYQQYILDKGKNIEDIIKEQTAILIENNIALEQILNNIKNNTIGLWDREIFDSDFLSIMLGYGNLPAMVEINSYEEHFALYDDNLKKKLFEESNKKHELVNVPITFSIMENSIMPVVINSTHTDDYLKSLIIQLLYFYSGLDLKIITITNKYNEKKWEFMKYMPHSWGDNYEQRFFASSEEDLAQISMFLEHEYELRNSNNSEGNNSSEPSNMFSTNYLIVTDDYKLARELPIVEKILDNNKKLGFYLLIFEKSMSNLPSRFNKLIQIVDEDGIIIDKNTSDKAQTKFKISYIKDFEIEPYSKIISNVPLTIRSADYAIPSSLTFLDMFQAGRVEQLNISSRWTNNNPTISLKSPIGMKEDNKLVELDLHEKFHGPHGLIAGSTGSGKSEFIISFILSMAVNYHPYEVQFILIDYKGGGLAGAFENRETGIKIPHLVGTITNLDKSEMNRTLVSIKSELQRRQRVFNETRERLDESTIDIYKYQRLYREGKVVESMSHLFIISDEFAELKQQQPDFMDELVSAARIGRSLGVHLILATQKPSGVVDDQIWSNTRFRICLKVQTVEDSNELLKKPDAANIREAGRFYLQVGNDEIYELGQSGWTGAKYVPSDNVQKKIDDNIVFLTNTGEVIKTIGEEVRKEETEVDRGDQLSNIVKYLYNLANTQGLTFSKLWLDNIPDVIIYDKIIKKYNLKSIKYNIEPIIGEYDDPANQNQGYISLPLMKTGNVFIAGSTGSGKSTLLSTLVYSTIINHNSNEVNIYIIDLGTEKLKVFQNAPQVGDVLTIADADKIKFLFYMLIAEKDKRFSYYSNNGGDFERDVKNKRCPFPSIVVIISQFDVFRETFEDLFDETFVPFTRNCTKVGITFIVTSTSSNSLGYMADNNFPEKIMLNMIDSSSYNDFFDKPPIPKKNAGRGLIKREEVYEFQTLLVFDENLYDSNLEYVINQLDKFLIDKSKRIPIIPDEVTVKYLKQEKYDISTVPIGVNTKTAQIERFDFNSKINILCSNDYVPVKNFMKTFLEIISSFKDKQIIIINSLKDINIDVPEEIKYYDSSYSKIMNIFNKNIEKYKTEGGSKQFLIIFMGYAGLQQYFAKQSVEDDSTINIDDLIISSKECDNFKYIIYDREEGIKKLSNSRIDNLFKHNNGIWIGKGFDMQNIFETSSRFEEENLSNNSAVVLKNGKVNYIKFN